MGTLGWGRKVGAKVLGSGFGKLELEGWGRRGYGWGFGVGELGLGGGVEGVGFRGSGSRLG